MHPDENLHRLRAIATPFVLTVSAPVFAASAAEIDASVDEAVGVFPEDVNGGEVFLEQPAGYPVFPRVIKVGVGIGGEMGEGAPRVGGSTVDHWRTTRGSFGFPLGAQARRIVIAFMTRKALDDFRNSSGWKVGIDGSVALIDRDVGKPIDTKNIRDPVVGFSFASKGLMYNPTLEGSNFSKLDKSSKAAAHATPR